MNLTGSTYYNSLFVRVKATPTPKSAQRRTYYETPTGELNVPTSFIQQT